MALSPSHLSKLDYFFFSAEAFYKSELAWQETKRLIALYFAILDAAAHHR
jgi:hypothetical protein